MCMARRENGLIWNWSAAYLRVFSRFSCVRYVGDRGQGGFLIRPKSRCSNDYALNTAGFSSADREHNQTGSSLLWFAQTSRFWKTWNAFVPVRKYNIMIVRTLKGLTGWILFIIQENEWFQTCRVVRRKAHSPTGGINLLRAIIQFRV